MNAHTGIALTLNIGQRVRHHDYNGTRVTGVVRGISVSSDRVLEADIVLDAPIVIPSRGEGDREISIWHQHVAAHELTPFDARDELIAEMMEALAACIDAQQPMQHAHAAEQARTALAKAQALA